VQIPQPVTVYKATRRHIPKNVVCKTSDSWNRDFRHRDHMETSRLNCANRIHSYLHQILHVPTESSSRLRYTLTVPPKSS